jgi:hypothetical protein
MRYHYHLCNDEIPFLSNFRPQDKLVYFQKLFPRLSYEGYKFALAIEENGNAVTKIGGVCWLSR